MAFRDIDVANERTLGLLFGLKRQKLQVKEPIVEGRTLLTISRKDAYLKLLPTLNAQKQGLTGRTLLERKGIGGVEMRESVFRCTARVKFKLIWRFGTAFDASNFFIFCICNACIVFLDLCNLPGYYT